MTNTLDDFQVLLAQVKRYSRDGKQSVTIPNGDVPTVIAALTEVVESRTAYANKVLTAVAALSSTQRQEST